MTTDIAQCLEWDRQHLIHPYTSLTDPLPAYMISNARGCRLTMQDGRVLIDGMSSWWAAIHGYNHPVLNQAVNTQLSQMSHVMFGGLTHLPAIELGQQLLQICPPGLSKIFFCDSGSVAVEAAIKMSLQYWQARKRPEKHRMVSLRHAYHGDTFAAMSVCDPVTGMHSLFASTLKQQLFAAAPNCGFDETCLPEHMAETLELFSSHHNEIAALIVEPIVQGAGGMRFYSPAYLRQLRQICDEYDVLLIADEIATGFGRTGKLFACEHADITPDIMCLGKALTGGYMTLAATLTSDRVAGIIGSAGLPFMHGPTFMANPLACATACASVGLLLNSPWQQRIATISQTLAQQLEVCRKSSVVADVRILGAIGVVEMKKAVNMRWIQQRFVELGVWVRPFGRLIYLMPPYIISQQELITLTTAVTTVINDIECQEEKARSQIRTGT